MDKQCRKRLSNRTQTRHNYVFRRLKTCAYMMLMLCFVAARLSLSSTHRNWDEVRWAPTNIDDRLCRHIESIARRAKALGFCARLIMNINWKTSFVQLNFHCNAGETSADCNETEWHCRFDALMSSPCSGRGSHSRRWNQITRQLICHPCANAQTANCVCFSDPTKRTQPFNCQNRVTQLNSHHPNSTESAKPKKKSHSQANSFHFFLSSAHSFRSAWCTNDDLTYFRSITWKKEAHWPTVAKKRLWVRFTSWLFTFLHLRFAAGHISLIKLSHRVEHTAKV